MLFWLLLSPLFLLICWGPFWKLLMQTVPIPLASISCVVSEAYPGACLLAAWLCSWSATWVSISTGFRESASRSPEFQGVCYLQVTSQGDSRVLGLCQRPCSPLVPPLTPLSLITPLLWQLQTGLYLNWVWLKAAGVMKWKQLRWQCMMEILQGWLFFNPLFLPI